MNEKLNRYMVYVTYEVKAESAEAAWSLIDSLATEALNQHKHIVGVDVQGAYGEDTKDYFVVDEEVPEFEEEYDEYEDEGEYDEYEYDDEYDDEDEDEEDDMPF